MTGAEFKKDSQSPTGEESVNPPQKGPPFLDKLWGVTDESLHFQSIDLRREVLVPFAPHPGAFGVVRRFHVHEGVDLYCQDGEPVHAIEAGIVKDIIPFTGPSAGSPWWLDTMAVMVEGESGVINYGEIVPEPGLVVGKAVNAGDRIGAVSMVLREDKGRPRSMLHLELLDKGAQTVHTWERNGPKPDGLFDPTALLLDSVGLGGFVNEIPGNPNRNGASRDWFRHTLAKAAHRTKSLEDVAPDLRAKCDVSLECPHSAGTSAILLPFVRFNGADYLVMTKRASTLRVSPGEIVFPGGRCEQGEDLIHTALRECSEEIGLSLARSSVVGTLPTFYRDIGKGYLITPVVAYVELSQLNFTPAPAEVEEIVMISVKEWLARAGRSGPFFPVMFDGKGLAKGNSFALEVLRRGMEGQRPVGPK